MPLYTEELLRINVEALRVYLTNGPRRFSRKAPGPGQRHVTSGPGFRLATENGFVLP